MVDEDEKENFIYRSTGDWVKGPTNIPVEVQE